MNYIIFNLIVGWDQRICNSWEYTSDLSARFNSWLCSQNKRKVDAELSAAREEQNWFSELSVHNSPESKFLDVYSLIYNFSGVN